MLVQHTVNDFKRTAKYKFKEKYIKIGSCKHSDIAVFSLHPVKTITSGEGGVITTNNTILYNRQKLLRSHCIIRENKKEHWKYEINNIEEIRNFI